MRDERRMVITEVLVAKRRFFFDSSREVPSFRRGFFSARARALEPASSLTCPATTTFPRSPRS